MKMKTRRIITISLVILAALVLVIGPAAWWFTSGSRGPSAVATQPSVPTPDYWPTNGWQSRPPEELGFDSDKLADLLLSAREKNIQVHSFLVIRHGYVVVDATFYPYDGQDPHNVASITKSLMTTLIGIAVDQGTLSLDDKMVSFFPDHSIANLDERKQEITVRHLASMSSGLDCTAEDDERTLQEMVASPDYVQFVLDRKARWEPGTHFVYCSPAIHLLSPILTQATGMSTLDFADQYLFEPLGFGEVLWPQDPQGYYDGWADVSLYPHDMAKLGFLFLNGGQWDGGDRGAISQIISRQWVEEAGQAQVQTSDDPYGYGWWIDPVAEGAYHAQGRGGQNIYVIPSWDMIIVTTGGGFEFDEIAEMFLDSYADLESLPDNPEGVARLQEAVAAVAQPPERTAVAQLPDLAREISGKTFVFDPNPSTLESIGFEFDDSDEAVFIFQAIGGPLFTVVVGLDGVYRFTPGFDGRPAAFRGAWLGAQTFLLEYDGITNNDHSFFRFTFEADRVKVSVQETAHETGVQFEGALQQP
jgi:CubicO group peptidase (beta-lactamase class C family)